MPLNEPKLDSRGYRELVAVVVLIISIAITLVYPNSIPLASYIVMPGTSALRDSTIPIMRAGVNGLIWGVVAYVLLRIPESLRHRNRL